jgi:perosamine synthetase
MREGLKMERIPVSGPWVTEKEVAYATDAAANAWYENANMYNDRFERAFAEYLGVKYAISLPSCTSGIHLSLMAEGVKAGDEVIVPDITWIATAAPISYVGATPVFADIDEKTWCLSAESFASCITEKTRAVIPVDLYGNLPDMDAIREVAARHGIFVIEDSAEAVGSEFKGRKAGSLGDAGVFSFHGSKTLTTGEGGMLVTDRTEIYERALFLRDHGRPPGDKKFLNTEVACKYRMSSMQAAFGLGQLERIEKLVQRKRDIFSWYTRELSQVEEIILNYERGDVKNTYWMVTVILDDSIGLDKFKVMELLSERGIDSRPFFHPLSSLPAYEGTLQAARAKKRNEVSYRIAPRGVNLPSGMNMTQDKVKYVCDVIKDICWSR